MNAQSMLLSTPFVFQQVTFPLPSIRNAFSSMQAPLSPSHVPLVEGKRSRCRYGSCASVSSLRYICTGGQFPTLKGLPFRPCLSESDAPDGVASPQSNPLWDGPVLLLRLSEFLLRPEGFVGLYPDISTSLGIRTTTNTYRHPDWRHGCLSSCAQNLKLA